MSTIKREANVEDMGTESAKKAMRVFKEKYEVQLNALLDQMYADGIASVLALQVGIVGEGAVTMMRQNAHGNLTDMTDEMLRAVAMVSATEGKSEEVQHIRRFVEVRMLIRTIDEVVNGIRANTLSSDEAQKRMDEVVRRVEPDSIMATLAFLSRNGKSERLPDDIAEALQQSARATKH